MGDPRQACRVSATTIEREVDAISRAAFRARHDEPSTIEALGRELDALQTSCRTWLEDVCTALGEAQRGLEAMSAAPDEERRAALERVVTTLGILPALLVRGALPPSSDASLTRAEGDDAVAEGSRLEDDDFVDFGAAFASDGPAIGEEEASGVDMRSLPTFENEAREHLDQADLHLLALESAPGNEEALNALFRSMHTLKGSSAIIGLLPVKELAHEAEQVLELARAKQLRVNGAVCDTLFDALDDLRRLVVTAVAEARDGRPISTLPDDDVLAALRALAKAGQGQGEDTPRIGEILTALGAATPENVERAAAAQRASTEKKPLGEVLVSQEAVTARQVVQALRFQRAGAAAGAEAEPVKARSHDVVRVDAERLDRFVDAIGELVIAESMVAHSPDLRASPLFAKLARPIGQLDKIARTLQEMATSLRMVAVRDTFQRMQRTVRDVSRACAKDVAFVISGEGTELDKAVVDQLADPLMHLVRNAVDHGIEPGAERVRAGKPAQGRLELRAVHAGDEVHIEVEDDGRGLDRAAILAKAVERGLVRDDAQLTDSQIYALVFEPGFSTAKTITDISGRGVGTDVVKRTVEALRGRVEVSSEIGRGSVFRLRLPLTMAVIDGMLVAVGAQRYIVPTLSVVRTVQRSREEITELLGGARTVELNGKWLPVRSLAELLGAPKRAAAREDVRQLIVVVEHGGRRLGLVVDHLLGQQQIVIKNLGNAVEAAAIAGGAILPDGTVGLVLELADLIELAHTEARAAA